jgi:hypothetical protein
VAVQQVVASSTVVGGLEQLRELAASIQGTVGTLRLYRSDFAPGADSVEADFEAAEVDFDTYAPGTIAYDDPSIDGSGRPIMRSADIPFQNVDGTSTTVGGNSIGGAWIRTHQAGPPAVDAPIQFFAFPGPIVLAAPLSALSIDVVQVANNGQTYLVVEN